MRDIVGVTRIFDWGPANFHLHYRICLPGTLITALRPCKGKQLQKAHNLAANGVMPPSPLEGQKLHEQGSLSTVARGGFNLPNPSPPVNSHASVITVAFCNLLLLYYTVRGLTLA